MLAALHVLASWALTAFSLAYLALWTNIAALPMLVTLFFSFPLAPIGLFNFYFGGYEQIPGVTWVILSLLLGAGVTFLVSMFFV